MVVLCRLSMRITTLSPCVRREGADTTRYPLFFLVATLLPLVVLSAGCRFAPRTVSALGSSYNSTTSSAQNAQVFELSGNLKQDILDPAAQTFLPRDQDLYRIPTSSDLNVWRQVISAMLHGAMATAAHLVQPIAPSYKVIKFTDTSSTPARVYHLLLEADLNGTNIIPRAVTGWGLYAFDPTPVRDLAISIPHIRADTNTEFEGNEALVTLRPASLLLFTSHRCASNTGSSCDGSTTACARGFRVSDASHGANPSAPTLTSTFQVAHEELVKLKPSTVVIQFHGNAQTACSDVVLSNGGNNFQIIPDGNIVRLKQSLVALSINVIVCDHRPTPGECNLCGTTNLQARYSNGSTATPCQNPGPSPTNVERFIHVEQSQGIRQTPQTRRTVIQALEETTFARCGYLVSPISQYFGQSGGGGSVSLTALAGCSWMASTFDNWVVIVSGAGGMGNGTVEYEVRENFTGSARQGTLLIAGQVLTIIQDGR